MKRIFERFSGDSRSVDIDSEKVHEFLSNERRRQVVAILSESEVGKTVSVATLADRLVEDHDDVRKNAYISLIQRHCVSFSSFLGFNEREKSVEVTPEVKAIAEAQKRVKDVVSR